MANNYEDLFNSDVVDVNGDKIGPVGQVYLDDHTGQPSWVTVKTGWFGLKETFVPLERAILTEGIITVPYLSDHVKDAPRVDPDKHLDAEEEARLYSYYGIATVLASEQPEAAEADEPEAEGAADEPEVEGAADEPEVEEPEVEEAAEDAEAATDELLLTPAEGQSPEEAAAPVIDESIDPQVAPADDQDEAAVAEAEAVEETVAPAVAQPVQTRPSTADLYNDVPQAKA